MCFTEYNYMFHRTCVLVALFQEPFGEMEHVQQCFLAMAQWHEMSAEVKVGVYLYQSHLKHN